MDINMYFQAKCKIGTTINGLLEQSPGTDTDIYSDS